MKKNEIANPNMNKGQFLLYEAENGKLKIDVRLQDVSIAKNYLNEDEIRALNNLTEQYLIFAEVQAMRRVAMHMNDWIKSWIVFLR